MRPSTTGIKMRPDVLSLLFSISLHPNTQFILKLSYNINYLIEEKTLLYLQRAPTLHATGPKKALKWTQRFSHYFFNLFASKDAEKSGEKVKKKLKKKTMKKVEETNWKKLVNI